MGTETTAPIDDFDVVIVGGGVAGGSLAAALAYADGNARVLLIEQTKHSSAINRGDFIHPPHMELLDRWGVLDEIGRRGAVKVTHNEFYSNSGALLLRHDFSFFGSRQPYGVALEHPEIEDALITVASRHPMVTVWKNTAYAGHTESNGTALVRLNHDNKALTIKARWVIAADGRNSKVRENAGIESIMRPYPYEILMTRIPNAHLGNRTLQFTGIHGYLGIFVANATNNRVAIPLPSGTASSFMQSPEPLRNQVLKQRAPVMEDCQVMWDHHHRYKLFEHHAPTYSKGRVILIGDSAHTFTPMLGMGMNLAFEEAMTLSTLLSSRSTMNNLTAAYLKTAYEDTHRNRNHRILKQSRTQGNLLVSGNKSAQTAIRASFSIASWFSPVKRVMFRSIFGEMPS